MVAAVASLLIIIMRLVLVNEQTKYTVGFGNESELLLLARLVNAAACFVLLGAITNYHFQKLWNKERDLRVEAERDKLDGLLAMAQARDNEAGNRTLRKKKYVGVLTDNLQSKGWFAAPAPSGPDDVANQNASRSAELVALADVYDVLTSRRPGKKTWTHKQAVAEIADMAGSRLNPSVVDAFLEEQSSFLAIAECWIDDANDVGMDPDLSVLSARLQGVTT